MEWINPMYLDTGVVKDIRARFEEESEIQLQEFLLVNFCSVTALELTSKQAPVYMYMLQLIFLSQEIFLFPLFQLR